jgi:two-component system chemotaxis sensor kinase CheA
MAMALELDLSQFHDVFFEESLEGLQVMEAGLLGLDPGSPDSETINDVFRAAHSMKGGAGTFGFTEIAAFTHVLETTLSEMREQKRAATRELIDTLLKSVDVLRYMLDCGRSRATLDAERVAAAQQALQSLPAQGPAAPAPAPAVTTGPRWDIRFAPHRGLLRSGNEPYRIFRELRALGRLEVTANADALPGLAALDPEDCYLAWNLSLSGDYSDAKIREVFAWVEGDCELELALRNDRRHRGERRRREDAQQDGAEAGGRAAEQASIRVNIGKVDTLINLVGELVITQSILNRLARNDESVEAGGKLGEVVELLERNTRELQDQAMRIRMVPMDVAFQRLHRLVRDLGHALGKKVDLQMAGSATEVDKTVLEKITDPLVHLVRNAMDHGIETPERRRAAGKPELGRLDIRARQEGGNIIIQVQDDGGGLSLAAILDKAREKNLIGPGEDLSDAQVQDLIFQPGFSTAAGISDVSGRGVGMDVVRRNITDLGGSVGVNSVPGQGCTFTIKLPLTLAILDAQLARVGGQIVVIPVLNIIESVRVKRGMVNHIAGESEVYRFRDEYIPVIRLHEVFGMRPQVTDLEQGLVIVVDAGHQKAALFVEDMVGQQQVVIKSLETNFRAIPGLIGATVLGDGAIAIILDIPGLVLLQAARRQRAMAVVAGTAA